MIIDLIAKPGCTLTVIAFKLAQVHGTTVRKHQAGPDCLNRPLAVAHRTVVDSDQSRPCGYYNIPSTSRVIDILCDEGTNEPRQVGIELLFEYGRDHPPGFDFILSM